MRKPGTIHLKRVYLSPAPEDGFRLLVERLWPRGLSKEKAAVDFWLKEVAPSTALRQWYGHVPEKWPEFQHRYREELAANPAVAELRALLREHRGVTFVFAAHDEQNSALVLKDFIETP